MKRVGLLALASLLGAGCVSVQLPPADLAAPGWSVQQTDAVWQPRAGAPELAGELMVAIRADGARLVQFSKQGLPLVIAQDTDAGWTLQSPLRQRGFSGRGKPTSRVPWFQLDQLPPAVPKSSRWQLTTNAAGLWRLANPRSGEALEGLR